MIARAVCRFLPLQLLLALALPAHAADRSVAVLDFELKDLTLAPQTAQESARTRSIAPLLGQALTGRGFRIAPVSAAAQSDADKGFGYLFDHGDAAATLAREAGVRWLVVGRLHKPSFLFAYLKARVIDATNGQLIADLVVEVKGPQDAATGRGVARLAEQIEAAVEAAP